MKSKKIQTLLAFYLLLSGTVFSQQQIVDFTYDDSGNRASRYISVERVTESDSLKHQEIQALDYLAEENIKVYPNPTYGKINIDFSVTPETPAFVTISDQIGRFVESYKIQNASSQIDLTTFGGGVYFLTIDVKGEKLLYKIVKQ